VTVTGTIFTELILVDPDCDSSFAGPGGHQGPGMGGPGMCDSLGFGHWDSTFFDGFGGYHQGNEWSGIHGNNHNWEHRVNASHDATYRIRLEEPDSLIYHEIFFMDVDDDSTMDYILNFGPAWYQPVDSTLSRPVAGDVVTVTGIQMMDSPQWEAGVLVVTELDGGIWREFGSMGPGGPHGPGMMQGGNHMIGDNRNFPNPFNPTTTISYNILDAGNVTITIYDITGRMVRTLVASRYQTPGMYRVVWNGTDMSGSSVASGLYLYSISAGGERVNRLITYLK
ncbi:MAG: T9SS type A sorting domain-containing protein, partial [Candidatus Marinimicrobia bacterium]|nr:T9SS type A sorting domain-containing protein [Candidatus Neomarinimicrobiota bacterium]